MIYYKVQFQQRNECYLVHTIDDLVDLVNTTIKKDNIMCHPVTKYIVATWTCRNKKASKYSFVKVDKITTSSASYPLRLFREVPCKPSA